MGNKWHSEQSGRLDTYGVEFVGLYHVNHGFLRRVQLAYAYINADRSSKFVTKSALGFLRHKAAATVGVRFLKLFTLDVTGSVNDRNGSYTHYPKPGDSSVTEMRDFEAFFLLDASLAWTWVTGGVTLTFGK